MRALRGSALAAFATALVSAGCNSILGIADHALAADAQPQDASEPDVASPGGPSLCDSSVDSGLVFCDGFENGLGAWAIATTDGGTVTTDSTHAYRGNSALHAYLPPTTVSGAPYNAELFRTPPVPWPQPMYVRFFAYLPSPKHGSGTSLVILNTVPALEGTNVLLTGNEAGSIALATFNVPNATESNAIAMPPAQWVCLELEVDGEHSYLWINSASTPSITLSFPVPTTNLALSLGLRDPTALAGDAPYEGWLDEIAVGSRYVGCDE
jgi:hypothetical protein